MDAESILKRAFPELCGEPANGVYELPPNAGIPPVQAQQQQRPPITPPAPPQQPSMAASLGGRFDVIAAEIHKLETQCRQERELAARWKQEAEQLARRLRTIEQSEKHLLAQVSDLAHGETSAASEKKKVDDELAKMRGELEQYRKAWVAIRKREEAARAAIQENGKLRAHLETLGHQARQLHGMCHEERTRAQVCARHAASLEQTMRQIQEKVQTLESRNIHLSTEIQTLHDLCKSYETEVARVSEATRAREEGLRQAAERELQARFERELQTSRKQAESELEAARKQASGELEAMRKQAEQESNTELKRARAELATRHESELDTLRAELESQHARDVAAMRSEFERGSSEERSRSERSISSLLAERERETAALERRARAAESLCAEQQARVERSERAAEQSKRAVEQSEHAAEQSKRAVEQGERAIEQLRTEHQAQLSRAATEHQAALAKAADAGRVAVERSERATDKLKSELELSGQALERECRRRAALEQECELMQTAVVSQFQETQEAAAQIASLAEEGAAAALEAIAAIAHDLNEASRIPTVAPGELSHHRAGSPSKPRGGARYDC